MNLSIANRIIFVASIVGLFVSSYMALEYTQGESIVCPIGGSGCDVVRLSPYSKLFGIHVPYLGVVFYTSLILLSIFSTTQTHLHWLIPATFLLGIVGVGMSGYFLFLEAFVIQAYCIYCLISGAMTVVIAGMARYIFVRRRYV